MDVNVTPCTWTELFLCHLLRRCDIQSHWKIIAQRCCKWLTKFFLKFSELSKTLTWKRTPRDEPLHFFFAFSVASKHCERVKNLRCKAKDLGHQERKNFPRFLIQWPWIYITIVATIKKIKNPETRGAVLKTITENKRRETLAPFR